MWGLLPVAVWLGLDGAQRARRVWLGACLLTASPLLAVFLFSTVGVKSHGVALPRILLPPAFFLMMALLTPWEMAKTRLARGPQRVSENENETTPGATA